jgi:hypothetical protein
MMKITPILSRFQKIRNWTNQQSKSCGIGQKKNSAPLAPSLWSLFCFVLKYPRYKLREGLQKNLPGD